MAITISGENNNDRILASDGVIDSLSGFNVVGVITATSFTGDLTGDVTGNLTGNVTGNINNTTLLLQTGGTERVRIASNGHVAIGTDSPNSALPLTIAGQYPGIQFKDNQGTTDFNINADSAAFRIQSGTAGAGPSEKFRIGSSGQIGLGGANYGSSGQVLTSGGSGSAVSWTTIAAQANISNNADNRVITGGSGVNLNGESNLTFNGNTLSVTGTTNLYGNGGASAVWGNTGYTGHLTYDGSNNAVIRAASGKALIFQTDHVNERLRIDSSGHISQGGGATPSTTNGNVGLKFGIKSALNNVIIGETTNGSMNGIILESRITGRSGGARCSQVIMGDGVINFETAPSGGAVAERARIDAGGLRVNKTTTSDYGRFEVKGPTADNILTGDIRTKTVATFSGGSPGTTAAGKGAGIVIKPISDRGCHYFFGVANSSANQEAQGSFVIRSGHLASATAERLRITDGGEIQPTETVKMADDKSLKFGNDNDLYIRHSAAHGNNFIVSSNGDIEHHMSASKKIIKGFDNSGSPYVGLYHNGNLRAYTVSNAIYVEQEQHNDDCNILINNKFASLSNNQTSVVVCRVARDAGGSHGGGNRQAKFGHNYNGSTGGGGFFNIRSNDGTNRDFYMDNNTNLRMNYGNSNIGTTNGTVVGSQSSDIRNKNLVGDGTVSYGLSEILQLNPIKYQYKKELVDRIGFSAQQVEPIIPESVYDTGQDQDNEGNIVSGDTIKAMYYVDLIPVLVNGIKELKAENDALKKRLDDAGL